MKSYYSLGLMSGTSMDGVDTSIIQSDGEKKYKVILDKYFEYPEGIYKDLTKIRDKIKSSKDLKRFEKKIKSVEKEITLFHAKAVNQILKKSKVNIDFIGFHGQTIFHSVKEKISRQLGDGKLLSKITKKTVVYNFRQNDLKNGGQGAPLTPIFHKLLPYKLLPVMILNLGGIANITLINKKYKMFATDIGPGNCLIDEWIRLNSKKNYDKNGKKAQSGKINKVVLDQALKYYYSKNMPGGFSKSFDIKDFDLSFVYGLSLQDGAATLTEFTSKILSDSLIKWEKNETADEFMDTPGFHAVLVCGGGRKNGFLLKSISKKIGFELTPIDDILSVNGDFVESQAFAYLAIRSYLKLPISFPSTTGVSKPCTGGVIVKS